MLARLRSRLLAVGLLLVVLFAAYSFAVEPLWQQFQDNQSMIAQQRELYARYRAISADRDQLEAQLVELKSRAAASGGYLPEASDTLAAAGLQDRLKRLLSTAGGTLKSIQPLPAVGEQGLQRITVRVQMTAETDALQEILFGLEAEIPFLFVDNVDIRKVASRSRRRSRRAATPVAENDNLQIRFDVYGYMRTV